VNNQIKITSQTSIARTTYRALSAARGAALLLGAIARLVALGAQRTLGGGCRRLRQFELTDEFALLLAHRFNGLSIFAISVQVFF
jgi:hypothetical protein